jgi:hypothetical protein
MIGDHSWLTSAASSQHAYSGKSHGAGDRSGGLDAETLGNVDDFSYVITERDADELAAAVAAFRRRGLPLEVSEAAAA